MPPKKERLSKDDFNKLSSRKIIRGQYFDIGYIQATQTKVACIVSKKTIKLAVERNRVRRKMYNIFSSCDLNKNYIIIIYPKKDALYTTFLELKSKMQEVFDIIK